MTYDPKVVRYDQLLQIFFSVVADPTHAQPPGPRPRHAVPRALVPMSAEQTRGRHGLSRADARQSGVWKPADRHQDRERQAFYPAEAYHQDFAQKNPNHGYIVPLGRAQGRGAARRCIPTLYRATFKTG